MTVGPASLDFPTMIFLSKTLLIIALILLGQLTALVHAAEFKGALHAHNGVTCLALLHDEETFPLVRNNVAIHLTAGFDPRINTADPSPNLPNINIKPPATGPPSL